MVQLAEDIIFTRKGYVMVAALAGLSAVAGPIVKITVSSTVFCQVGGRVLRGFFSFLPKELKGRAVRVVHTPFFHCMGTLGSVFFHFPYPLVPFFYVAFFTFTAIQLLLARFVNGEGPREAGCLVPYTASNRENFDEYFSETAIELKEFSAAESKLMSGLPKISEAEQAIIACCLGGDYTAGINQARNIGGVVQMRLPFNDGVPMEYDRVLLPSGCVLYICSAGQELHSRKVPLLLYLNHILVQAACERYEYKKIGSSPAQLFRRKDSFVLVECCPAFDWTRQFIDDGVLVKDCSLFSCLCNSMSRFPRWNCSSVITTQEEGKCKQRLLFRPAALQKDGSFRSVILGEQSGAGGLMHLDNSWMGLIACLRQPSQNIEKIFSPMRSLLKSGEEGMSYRDLHSAAKAQDEYVKRLIEQESGPNVRTNSAATQIEASHPEEQNGISSERPEKGAPEAPEAPSVSKG